MSVTGTRGTNSIDCLKVPLKFGPTCIINDTIKIRANCYKDLVVGTWFYIVTKLRKRYSHLLCLRRNKIDFKDAKMMLVEDACSLKMFRKQILSK